MMPLFEENAGATFARATRIFRERGDEYGDTWRNSQHLTLRAVYRELMGEELPLKFCRAIAAGVLVDVKHQRMEGRYKSDSLVDGMNYQAFLVEEMRKLKEESLPKCATCNHTGLVWLTTDISEPCPVCRPRIPSMPEVLPPHRSV